MCVSCFFTVNLCVAFTRENNTRFTHLFQRTTNAAALQLPRQVYPILFTISMANLVHQGRQSQVDRFCASRGTAAKFLVWTWRVVEEQFAGKYLMQLKHDNRSINISGIWFWAEMSIFLNSIYLCQMKLITVGRSQDEEAGMRNVGWGIRKQGW